MTNTTTFTSTIGPNHTIVLPTNLPVGSKVTITVSLTQEGSDQEDIRRKHFESVMEAIRVAIAGGFKSPLISNTELKALIKRAQASKY
jgi:hypothetical protein